MGSFAGRKKGASTTDFFRYSAENRGETMLPILTKSSSNSAEGGSVFKGSAETLSDEMLVRAAQTGDVDAFDELCVRHARKVFRMAIRITKNREDAEDVLQEAFLSAF
jgi:hypothetical protein